MNDQIENTYCQDNHLESLNLVQTEESAIEEHDELLSIIEQVKSSRGEASWTPADIDILKAGAMAEIKYYLNNLRKKLKSLTGESSENRDLEAIKKYRAYLKPLTPEKKDAIALEIMKGSSIDEAFAQCSEV